MIKTTPTVKFKLFETAVRIQTNTFTIHTDMASKESFQMACYILTSPNHLPSSFHCLFSIMRHKMLPRNRRK